MKTNKLIIKPADKNFGLTIMHKDWYEFQVKKHLNSKTYQKEEPSLYKIIGDLYTIKEYTFTKRLYIQSKELYLKWTDKSKIWKIPEFYVMPKLHKSPIKSRPIVPSHSWVTTEASKWLNDFYKKCHHEI